MTLIFGYNGLNEVLMVADSRISFADGKTQPKDILLKLYSLPDISPPMTLGFCGRLSTIKNVMHYLATNKLRDHKNRYVVPEFAERLRQWIEEAVKRLTIVEERKGLAFMLGGLEARRSPKSFRSDGSYSYLNLPTGYLYKYSVRPSDGQVALVPGNMVAAIGSGSQISQELERKGNEYLGAGFGSEMSLPFRATIISSDIASTYRNLQFETVGGPFQTVRLTPQGHIENYIFPPEEDLGNFEYEN